MHVALPERMFKGLVAVSQALRGDEAMRVLPFIEHAGVSEVMFFDGSTVYAYSDGTRIDVSSSNARCTGGDEQKCTSNALRTAEIAYTALEAYHNVIESLLGVKIRKRSHGALSSLGLSIDNEVYARAFKYAQFIKLPAIATIDRSVLELPPRDDANILEVSIRGSGIAINLGDATVKVERIIELYAVDVFVEHSGYTVEVCFSQVIPRGWDKDHVRYEVNVLGINAMSYPRVVKFPVSYGDEIAFARKLISKAVDAVARAVDAVRSISVDCHYPPWMADSVLKYAFERGAFSHTEVCSEVLAYKLSVLARVARTAYGALLM
ncbi:MAG: hypothetical protein QW196_02410 [Sulfolobales archaeon]